MSLHLDPRQRAMLQEMGVRLWWPAPVTPSATSGPSADPLPHSAPAPAVPPPAASARPPAAPPPARVPQAPPPASLATNTASPAVALQLHPPRTLYPSADPLQAPAALGAGWLIVAEGQPEGDPFAGDAGRLLANMLRALQLHRHPRVHLCALSAPAGAAGTEPPAAVLAAALADLQPSVLLLMGRTAARAVLGRTEPLGRLRSELHQVGGVPAVVTYDAPYLLRAPDAKPAAWADLCRARALGRAIT